MRASHYATARKNKALKWLYFVLVFFFIFVCAAAFLTTGFFAATNLVISIFPWAISRLQLVQTRTLLCPLTETDCKLGNFLNFSEGL